MKPDALLCNTVLSLARADSQETPHCASVSFERHAANAFQRYVHGALNFSIKRGGLLYGSVGEGGHVRVDAIYEPPQVPSLPTVHRVRFQPVPFTGLGRARL